jgi:hypothetical protein
MQRCAGNMEFYPLLNCPSDAPISASLVRALSETPGCKSRVRVPLTRLSQPQSGRPARLRYIDGEPITEGNGTPAWKDDWRLWPTSKHAFHRL